MDQVQRKSNAQESGFRFSVALLLLFVGAFAVQAFLPAGQPLGRILYFASLVGPCMIALVWGLATGNLIFAAHKRPAIAWICIGVGTGLCGFGELFYNLPQLLGTGESNDAKWIDILFLSSYLLQAIGFLLLSPSQSSRAKIRVAIDSATIAVAGGFFLWTFLLKKTVNDHSISELDRISALLYPTFGLFVIWAALKLFTEKTLQGHSVRTSLIALIGITTYVGSDIYWSFLEANSSYASGRFGDIGWPIGYGLVALATIIAFRTKPRSNVGDCAERSAIIQKLVSLLIPTVAFLTTIVIAWGDYRVDSQFGILSLSALLAMSVLLSARQIVSLLESQDTIKKINEDLETIVTARTAELEDRVDLVVRITHSEDLESACELAASALSQYCDALGCGVHLKSIPGEERPFGHLRWVGDHRDAFKVYDAFEPGVENVDEKGIRTATFVRESDQFHLYSVPLCGSMEQFGSVACVYSQVPDSLEINRLGTMASDLSSALGQLFLSFQAVAASEVDYLTGLLNHRAVSRRFHKVCENARETNPVLGVITLDIANFRMFNDTYGHVVGDELLRKVGRELKNALGSAVIIGRTGSDEFMIILQNANLSRTYKVARLVNETISNINLIPEGYTERIPISAHIGLASYPESSSNPYVVLTKAAASLEEAKKARFEITEEEVYTAESKKHLADDSVEIIEMFVTAIDNMDSYTRRHSEDVMKYAVWIGEELEASPEVLQTIATAALLHDIGKIAVPSSILQKPAALNEEEQLVVRQHPYIGSLIVQALPGMAGTVDGVLHHHEHYDGTGYPYGLAGKDIPFLGRLLAVADAYSAMTTDRPYRRGMDPQIAAGRITAGRGTQFDPEFTDAMIGALVRRGICVDPGEVTERRAA